MFRLKSLIMILLICTTSFVLTSAGKVVPASKICPANEFYTDCGDNCQTECATLGQPCTIRFIRCPEGCYCNKGYARNAHGKCIPIGYC